MKIIIIEDEALAARDLERTVKEIDPDCEILATLNSVDGAVNYFRGNQYPDLIFADIQLGNNLSFEIFKTVSIPSPIIFCTAFNEYAIDAFKTNGIDYVLKPFSKENIAAAIDKYKNMRILFGGKSSNLNNVLEQIEARLQQKPKSVLVQLGNKIIPLSLSNIALFFIENEYSNALTFDGKKYPLNETLEVLEGKYSPHFFRANRQFLVNRKAVKEASHDPNRKIRVWLTIPFKDEIIVGKLRISAFTSWLASC